MARHLNNELVCDMAETYGVFDWRALPARLAATLAAGLRDDSRVKLAAAGSKVSPQLLVAALAADSLRLLVWQNTKDGQHGRNAPASITAQLCGNDKEESAAGFDSPEAFRAWREKMIGGGELG